MLAQQFENKARLARVTAVLGKRPEVHGKSNLETNNSKESGRPPNPPNSRPSGARFVCMWFVTAVLRGSLSVCRSLLFAGLSGLFFVLRSPQQAPVARFLVVFVPRTPASGS